MVRFCLLAGLLAITTGSLCTAMPPGFQVFFTDPEDNSDTDLPDAFVDLIDSTEEVFRGAFYSIDHRHAVDAMIARQAALGAGSVRIITDAQSADEYQVQRLRDAGIPVIDEVSCGGVSESVECHNKFAVGDGRTVWTGSWNMTYSAVLSQHNNALLIDCPLLAQQYGAEFNEMWGSAGAEPNCTQARFSNYKTFNTQTLVSCGGVELEVYFAPWVTGAPQIDNRLIELIENAQESIHFCMYTFTSNEIGEALIAAHERGISVQGVIDDSTAYWSSSEYQELVDAGLAVKVDSDVFTEGHLLHHKFMVVDPFQSGALVATGSYNWTSKAEHENDENVLVVHNAEVAQAYYDEFYYCYNGRHTDKPEIDLQINGLTFRGNQRMVVDAQLANPGAARQIDLYVLLDVGVGRYWFYPSWCEYPPAVDCEPLMLPGEQTTARQILNFVLPEAIGAGGPFYFHGGLLDHGGAVLLSLDTVEFYFL